MITDFEILDYLNDTFQTNIYKDMTPILSQIPSEEKGKDTLLNLKKRDWISLDNDMRASITHGGYIEYLKMIREQEIRSDNKEDTNKAITVSVASCVFASLSLSASIWLPLLSTPTKLIITVGSVVILAVIIQSQLRKGKKS